MGKYIEEAKGRDVAQNYFTNDFEITFRRWQKFLCLEIIELRSADSRILGTFKYSDIIGKKDYNISI